MLHEQHAAVLLRRARAARQVRRRPPRRTSNRETNTALAQMHGRRRRLATSTRTHALGAPTRLSALHGGAPRPRAPAPRPPRSLGSYGASGALPGDAAHGLAVSARSLFARMARSAAPVPPLEFVLALRRQYPQFGQQGRDGHYMQQDAEECWTNLMYTLRERLKARAARAAGAAWRCAVVHLLLAPARASPGALPWAHPPTHAHPP